ncbi:MAG: cation:proton antiporter, partial [Thiotrichaceae bacterium]|nr:cation:proton antiporter [Thiotrichaceae bacterium]
MLFKPSQWKWAMALFIFAPWAYASGGSVTTIDFLWIAVLLLLAKVSSLIEKWGQPAVLGELIIGVLLGNLVLLGFGVFESVKHDHIILFLAELGVVILLFQIGLESKIDEMRKVGIRALMVAVVGVVAPFGLGYLVGMWLMPDLSSNALLFLGATLTATSVGITGRVFRDLGKLQTREAQIVLGAAVIDDVMGLIILAVVSAIVTTGAVSIGSISQISLIAIAFLVGAIFLGQIMAPRISQFFSMINTGVGMKFTIAISFCLIFAYLAALAGLAPIVGAFAAGLMLESVHFKSFSDPTINKEIQEAVAGANKETQAKVVTVLEQHSERHLDNLMAPLGHFLVPLFFVVTGMQVDLTTLFDPRVVGIALAITVVAFFGKLLSGIVAGPVNKYIVGWGMAPRGEVGLIFAMIGKQLGVI